MGRHEVRLAWDALAGRQAMGAAAGLRVAAGRRHIPGPAAPGFQMMRRVIALSTARVRSRVPSLSRMVET